MVFPAWVQFLQQGVGLGPVPSRDDEGEALSCETRNDRPCSTAGSDDSRHAEIMLLAKSIGQGFEKSRHIGIAPNQLSISRFYDGVHRANLLCQWFEAVEQWHDCLLVRHGDIASTPIRSPAPVCNIVRKSTRIDLRRTIIGVQPQPFYPETVNRGRFGLRDRIADHLGMARHDSKAPSSRKASSTCSRGIPSTVNWSPMIPSKSCAPGPSIRNTPTHWLTAGHSASR